MRTWPSIVDTSDEWIVERTGIRERHIADEGERTSDLGIAAASQALVRAAIDPVDIDLVICATATPDRTFPATAVTIQAALGVTQGRRLRRAGGLLGLCLRDGDRRQFPEDGPVQARPGGRRGNVLAHSRLVGPLHLRAVRRRRGRRRARGADRSTARARTAASLQRASAPTDASRTCSTSMAARARPRPPATCG